MLNTGYAMRAIRSQASRCVPECTPHRNHERSSLWFGIQCVGTAVVVNVSNQALLGSSIAEQGNVSDAVSQVVEFQPLYTPVDSKREIVVGSSVGTVPSGESAVFGCRLSLNS